MGGCCTTASSESDVGSEMIRLFRGQKIQNFNISNENYDEILTCSRNPLNFLGCSQIKIVDTLYICGTSQANNDFDSSFLFSIKTTVRPFSIKQEVNCFSAHYYPTLAAYETEYMFVIGGKRTVKCELYFIQHKKWKKLPDLPSEKYGCTALMHQGTYSIYVFGGVNRNNIFDNTLIKMALPSCAFWEEISYKETDYILLQRAFSISCISDGNTFLILGGSKVGQENCDDILMVDVQKDKFNVIKTKYTLPVRACFRHNKIGAFNSKEKAIFCFSDDEEHEVMKVDMITGTNKLINPMNEFRHHDFAQSSRL